MKTNEQYYAFYLDDPGICPICSFDKLYVGTLSELKEAVEAMKADGSYKDTVAAFEGFLNGCTDGTHIIAQQRIPILTPVELKATTEFTLESKTWEHLNAWRWPYNMKFDKAEIKEIIVKHEGRYHRLMKAKIWNLCYESLDERWDKLNQMFWGHGYLLKLEDLPNGGFTMTTLLYEFESTSDRLKDEKAKLGIESELLFDSICDEVFGDG